MEFSSDERRFLGAICSYFHRRATWPDYGYLDKALSQDREDFDVEVIGRQLEPFMYDDLYVPAVGWDPKRPTFLSISALHTCVTEGICPEVGEDLDAFMQVVQLCVEKYWAEDDNGLRVTEQEVRDRYGMSDLMLSKVYRLVDAAGLYSQAGYDEVNPGEIENWTFTVSPNIRRYRTATTIEEFVAVRQRLRSERQDVMSLIGGRGTPRVPGQMHAPAGEHRESGMAGTPMKPISLFSAGPFTRNEHLCFVLMPFREDLRAVYDDAIVPAATNAKLECRRADEIFKPGPIMGQVWESVGEAQVVVADLTDMNANVFYELGLAHAIGRDAILLTQDMKWVPFDLRHMRCIVYDSAPHGLRLLEQKLRKAIKEVLVETGQSKPQS